MSNEKPKKTPRKSNIVTVYERQDTRQKTITIPKAIAEAMGLEGGSNLEFEIAMNGVVIRKVRA